MSTQLPPDQVRMPGVPNPSEAGGEALRFSFDRDRTVDALVAETVEKSVQKLSAILKAGAGLAGMGILALGLQGVLQQCSYSHLLEEQQQRNTELQQKADALSARAESLQGRVSTLDDAVTRAESSAAKLATLTTDQTQAYNQLLTAQASVFINAVGTYGAASREAAHAASTALASVDSTHRALYNLSVQRDSAQKVIDSARRFEVRYQTTADLVDQRLRNTWTVVLAENPNPNNLNAQRILGSDFAAVVDSVSRSKVARIRLFHIDARGQLESACGHGLTLEVQGAPVPCEWNRDTYFVSALWAVKQHRNVFHHTWYPDLVGIELRRSESRTSGSTTPGTVQ